jgi:glycosyltransferase involved in cell wall biosynthesis
VKILISSHAFSPSLGGIETVSALLAEEFTRLGHSVVIVTQTANGSDRTQFGAPIVRRPSSARLMKLVKWCDVFWHNNLSLRTVWPAFLLRKRIVITHSGSYCRRPVGVDLALRIKHAVVNRFTSVAISKHVASFFETDSVVIPNPYDSRVFQTKVPPVERKHELVFLGRIVSEKGLDIFLKALGRLKQRSILPQLSVVGFGPELANMRELTKKLGLESQVRFVGAKSGPELVQILNEHQILVVPSRYDEPFGVVALEGLACGCVVIGSSGGGLPDAIGPCGITFLNGDVDALEKALAWLLTQTNERERIVAHASEHLAQFQPHLIAQRYLELFQKVAP